MNNENNNDEIVVTQNKTKKITFFSAVILAMGSCIGAGIFFKSESVLNNSGGSLVLAMMSWVLAAFTVLSMAFALIEINSSNTKNNLSLIGWNKTFCKKIFYKMSKNFMFYLYLPLTFFFMPLYVTMSIQDGWMEFMGGSSAGANAVLGTGVDWLIWTLISLSITTYFITFAGYKAKIGNVHNKIIMMFKFIPLLFAGLIGFIMIIQGTEVTATADVDIPNISEGISKGESASNLFPFLGIFTAIGSIFFAYDGFYITVGVQSEMKEPKKTSLAILLGLSFVSLIYIIISISLSLFAGGSISGLREAMENAKWNEGAINGILGTINILIAIGILGIINGFALWSPRFIEDAIKDDEIPFGRLFKHKLNPHYPKVGVIYTLIFSITATLVFTIIGTFGYFDAGGYGDQNYGKYMGALYSFADLMASWLSVFVFVFVMLPIVGALKNRKTNKIKVEKSKNFVPFAWIAIIMVSIAMIIQVLIPIIDLFLLIGAKDIDNEIIVARVVLIFVLILFFALTYIPSKIEIEKEKKLNKSTNIHEEQKETNPINLEKEHLEK